MISVILINWKKPVLTKRCWDFIHANADSEYELIIIENENEDRNREIFYSGFPLKRLKTISNKENVGFIKAANQGIKEAEGEFICLINNDALILSKFFKTYIENYKDKVGVIGPMKLFAEGVDFIEGSCFFIKKDLIESIGCFDERYGIGCFEDVDVCKTLQSKGYEILQIPFHYQHTHATTFGIEAKMKQTEINRKIFREKWKNVK